MSSLSEHGLESNEERGCLTNTFPVKTFCMSTQTTGHSEDGTSKFLSILKNDG